MAKLIDGDALIAWIKGSQQMTSKMKNIICYIKTMPTIEVRPKGEWIKNIDGNYECSECHVAIRGDDKPIYPFCAWCGADMRGE